MRVLLLIPHNPRRRIPSPEGMPLGLLYLASMIKADHDVRIVDEYSFPDDNNALQTIIDFSPDVVAISIPFKMLENPARNIAEKIREIGNAKIVIGGIHATNAIKRIRASITHDYMIPGEGENLFKTLINGMDSKKEFHVEGILEPQNSFKNKEPIPIEIEKIPYPSRYLLPYREKYLERILSSRGCGFNCAFCASRKFWGGFRGRNADKIIDELLEIYSERGHVPVSFADDSLTYSREHVLNLCDRIKTRRIATGSLGFSSHPNRLDEYLLDSMKDAGFDSLFIGLESGSDKVLKRIGKKYDREHAEKMIRFALGSGFDVHASFMIGLPGENKEDLDLTLAWADELPLKSIGFHIFYPFEGCEIRENADRFGIKIVETDINDGDIDGEAVIHNGVLSPGEILEYYYKARALARMKSSGN